MDNPTAMWTRTTLRPPPLPKDFCAVSDAVAAMNQTYVNDLKSAGTFNEAEQKEALMRAVSAALKSMSSDAQDYIKSTFGDTTQYLENRIEAQIDANHVAAKQAAAQNTLNLG